ncbi:MAG: nucleotidyltransferase [Chloroflexi bacterium RBG_16_54_18]|nr:MAG: nucleotidyltransferase [Chloroflexi bacterium RBG_16_54_18]
MEKQLAISILHKNHQELADQFGVKSLALFGSVARDEAIPGSDIDLLVEFNRPVGLFGLFALQNRLEEILGCKVDLGTRNSLKPRLKKSITADLVITV